MQYLQTFCKIEEKFKCQPLNEDDNKKTIKKMAKVDVKPWMEKYQSTSRTLWRGVWFIEFIGIVCTEFVNQRTAKMSKIAGEAYDAALAPHHPWALKKVAGMAMRAVKAREKFEPAFIADMARLTDNKAYSMDTMIADFTHLGE